MSEEKRNRCFTWCVRLKQACNKRWARAINRLRRRFHDRRGQRVDPETIIDETGARDMVLSKAFIDIPDMFATRSCYIDFLIMLQTLTENTPNNETVDDQDFDIQVSEYVSNILQAAVDSLSSEVPLPSNTNMITMDEDANVSLTSSVISQIADIAVTESLTTATMENDINQSATRDSRPIPESIINVNLVFYFHLS